MADDAIKAVRRIGEASNDLSKIFTKLSSGKRINKASDDAAGLAIANALEASAATTSVAKRNVDDAVSLISIGEGASGQLNQIFTRQAELSTQASNGTLSDAQRSTLDQEFQALSREAERIVATTEFNGTKIFSGSSTTIQAGTDSSANSQIAVQGGSGVASVVASLAGQSIATQASAQTALNATRTNVENISSAVGQFGSVASRLNTASNNLVTRRENELAAASRITDADIGEASAELTAAQIRQRSGSAVLGQANKSKKGVLDLLA